MAAAELEWALGQLLKTDSPLAMWPSMANGCRQPARDEPPVFCAFAQRRAQAERVDRAASGLIGSHLVKQLSRSDVKEIVIYDNFVRARQANLAAALQDARVKVRDVGGDPTRKLQDALAARLANAVNINRPSVSAK